MAHIEARGVLDVESGPELAEARLRGACTAPTMPLPLLAMVSPEEFAQRNAVRSSEALRALEAAARAGELAWLVAVTRLWARMEHPECRGMAQDGLDAVALTRAPGAAAACLELAEEEALFSPSGLSPPQGQRERMVGARLGAAQPIAEVEAALGCFSLTQESTPVAARRREILACAVQEGVVRGKPAGGSEAIVGFWEEALPQDHPLAPLPLMLEGCEHELPKVAAEYGLLSAGGRTRPMPAYTDEKGVVRSVASRDVTSVARATRMASFSADARRTSNGRVEARVLRLLEPVRSDALDADFVRGLPLAALASQADWDDGIEDPELVVTPPSPPEAVRAGATIASHPLSAGQSLGCLAAVAGMGGVYNRASSDAYGRLYARESFAAILGAEDDAPWSAVVELAQSSSLFALSIRSCWFDGLFDFALLAMNDGGLELAFVAFTDVD